MHQNPEFSHRRACVREPLTATREMIRLAEITVLEIVKSFSNKNPYPEKFLNKLKFGITHRISCNIHDALRFLKRTDQLVTADQMT